MLLPIAEPMLAAISLTAVSSCDPLTSMPHDVDVKALIRLSGVYNVPIACNEATATLLVKALFEK